MKDTATKQETTGLSMTTAHGTTPPLSSGVKLLGLLSCIADTTEPVRVTDLARLLGAPRAAVHRQLVTLAVAGWVSQTDDGRYYLTMRAAHLGQAAFNHAGLSDRTMALLRELAESVGEVASLAVLDDTQVRIVQRAEPGRLLRGAGALGERFPIYGSASGGVILANADPGVLTALHGRGVRLPSKSDLMSIRKLGYYCVTVSDEVIAIAVPVVGEGRATTLALSVIGPRERVDLEPSVASLRSTASAIERIVAAAADLGAADVHWAPSTSARQSTSGI